MFRFTHRGKDELREFLSELDVDTYNRVCVSSYAVDGYVRDLFAATRGRVNAELARTLASESNGALHWMLDQSVRWEPTGVSREVDGQLYFDDPGYVPALRLMLVNMALMAFTFVPLHAMRMRQEAATYSAFTSGSAINASASAYHRGTPCRRA